MTLLPALAAAALAAGPFRIEPCAGKSSVRTNLPPVRIAADSVCGLVYSARSDAPANCQAGTPFAFLGSHEPGDGEWRERRVLFAAPSRVAPSGVPVHFGMWRPQGNLEIRDVRLETLRAEHSVSGGIELGGGERMDGNEYMFSFPFGEASRNAARPLVGYDCQFHGRLWWFKPGSRVEYRHRVAGRKFTYAKILAGSSDWSGSKGAVKVEVSADGGEWRELGEIKTRSAVRAGLPQDMFPFETLSVRLTGGEGCDLQVAHYNMKGIVDGEPVRFAGSTCFVSEDGKVFASVGPSVFDDSGYGTLLSSGEDAELWSASSCRKVLRTTPAPSRRGNGMSLAMAANEAESVQLVVRAGKKDVQDVRIEIAGDFTCEKTGGAIPAAAADVKRVGYVDVRHPTDFEGLPVPVPDKLLPVTGAPVRIAAGENMPFWITVRAPKGTKKGVYRGEVRVTLKTAGGRETKSAFPLDVEVFGFSLPDEMSCDTAFGLTPSLVAKAHRLEENAPEMRGLMERYLQAMADNRISPYRPAMFDMWRVTWNGDTPSFDFTAYDAAMDRALAKYGFNTFLVWLPGLGTCDYLSRKEPEFMGLKPDDPRYEKRLGAYLKAVRDHLDAKGWLSKAYVYAYDEPRPESYPLIRHGYGLLRKYAPGLRTMLPTLGEDTFVALDGYIDLWCPKTDIMDSPTLKKIRARGGKTWWYICNNPKAPYAGDFIDHPSAELRVWLWQTWSEKIDGILIWDVFNWRGQWKHPDENGEGRFLYPPEECARGSGPVLADPVQSVRLAHLRDGLEDYEYFAMLSKLSPENGLLKTPETVTSSLKSFAKDPGAMERHRVLLARAIERRLGSVR